MHNTKTALSPKKPDAGALPAAPRKRGVKLGVKAKLLGTLLPAATLIIAAILLLVYLNTAAIMRRQSEELLLASTDSVTNEVQAWMNKTLTALEQQRDALQYFPMTPKEELDYIKHTANQNEAYPAGIYIGTNQRTLIHASFVPGPDFDVFAKSWYNEGLKSEPFVFGSVYFDEDSQSFVVGASGMLKDRGGSVRGVAAADIYLTAISEIVQQIQLAQTGGAFLVDARTNTVIGHKDAAVVGVALEQQENPMYTYVGEHLKSQSYGYQLYNHPTLGEICLDIEPISGSDWVTVAYVPSAEVMSALNTLIGTILLIAVLAILLLWIVIDLLMRRTVLRPIRKIDAVARQIADGNLNQTIDYTSTDEFGMLANNFNKTVLRLHEYVNYIEEISHTLEEISQGNLDFSLTYTYEGEFEKVKGAFEQIALALNSAMLRISESSNHLTASAEQVSGAAQSLSQGATEQAGSIEALAATISVISGHIQTNAEDAKRAQSQSSIASEGIVRSNEKMREMSAAMAQISGKSGEIGKIIKTIEDIAFQTNILALNAAVEAARAGVAGKGFAVVADEVRNLASKSAEAAKSTASLIEETIHAVEKGSSIANDTAAAMMQVVGNAQDATALVEKISVACDAQAQSAAEVATGIDQIAGVVQMNSATAEESAAASEELAAQSQLLRGLVKKFRLRRQSETPNLPTPR